MRCFALVTVAIALFPSAFSLPVIKRSDVHQNAKDQQTERASKIGATININGNGCQTGAININKNSNIQCNEGQPIQTPNIQSPPFGGYPPIQDYPPGQTIPPWQTQGGQGGVAQTGTPYFPFGVTANPWGSAYGTSVQAYSEEEIIAYEQAMGYSSGSFQPGVPIIPQYGGPMSSLGGIGGGNMMMKDAKKDEKDQKAAS